jgi:hypothetical protein
MKKINLSETELKLSFIFLDHYWFVIFIYGSFIFLLISIFWAQEFRIENIPATANMLAVLIFSFFLGYIAWIISILSITIIVVIMTVGYLLISGKSLKFYWNRVFSPFTDKDYKEMNPGWKN